MSLWWPESAPPESSTLPRVLPSILPRWKCSTMPGHLLSAMRQGLGEKRGREHHLGCLMSEFCPCTFLHVKTQRGLESDTDHIMSTIVLKSVYWGAHSIYVNLNQYYIYIYITFVCMAQFEP